MNRPTYSALRKHFADYSSITLAEVYQWIGYPEYIDNPYMQNTCAIRVSLALLGVGISIVPGHLTVKAGKYSGKRIEQGQRRLSELLVRLWGEPEKYKDARSGREKIEGRKGVISFFQLWGATDAQGHIDIVAPDTWGTLVCENSCYWAAVEVWFWPLK